MARRFRDSGLESRAARAKLAVQAKPYYRAIGPGLNIGYRKNKKGGKWVARFYVGDKDYRLEAIADADDMLDADGETILDFWQAQDRARQMQTALSGETVKVAKRITVKEAVDNYIEWMEGNRKSAQDARYRADALILPALGMVNIGRIVGPYTYLPEAAPTYPNQRRVEWIKSAPREDFSQAALYEIGSFISLFRVKVHADEFRAAVYGPSPRHHGAAVDHVDGVDETDDDSVSQTVSYQAEPRTSSSANSRAESIHMPLNASSPICWNAWATTLV